MKRTIVLLLVTLVGGSVAEGDVLWFKNGRTLEGTVRELPGGQVEITLPYGTLAFSKDRVERVEKAVSVADIVDQALATLAPDDVDRLFELAEWCREKQEHTLAQRLYRQVLTQDPDHEGARQRLGHEHHQGTWMTLEEARLARGEVRFRGRWTSSEERRRVLREEEARQRSLRLENLEEARLALELSRYELEAHRVRRLPPAHGLPIYGGTTVFVPPQASAFPYWGTAGDHQAPPSESVEPTPRQRRPRDRRDLGTIPRHRRGGFVPPRR